MIRSRSCSLAVTPLNFDDMLDHVGGWGKFQIRLLLIFIPFTFFLAYVGYAPILFLYVPEHWCHIPDYYETQLNISDVSDLIDLAIPLDEHNHRSKCGIYDLDAIMSDGNTNQSQWPIKNCPDGWSYNFTGFFHSAATQFDWVCDDAWKSAFTQSIFYVGAIFGTLFFGWASDHYGRYWSFVASNTINLVTGIATPFAYDFVSFVILRFLMGLGFITFFMSLYMLTLEYVSKEKRSLVGNLSLALAMSLGGCFQPWILQYVQDWRIYHHILFGQTALILLAPWFVKESSRWLIAKGRIDEAISILKLIAEENGRTINPDIYITFKESATVEFERTKNVHLSWRDLFRTPVLRKNVILMVLNWSLTSVLFDGHIRNISNLMYSIYWTFTISSLLEFPSDLLSIWGLEWLGRRWSAVLSLIASGVAMLACAFAMDHELVVTILAMVGRFCITYSMNTAAQLSLEVVPTSLRGQGSALANVCAQASNLFAPQIVYSAELDPRLPFIILGLGGLLAGLLAFFLPETAGVRLPDTVEEAEEIFNNPIIIAEKMELSRHEERNEI